MSDTTTSANRLSSVSTQVERLITLGVPALAGQTDAEFQALVPAPARDQDHDQDQIVIIHPDLVTPAQLAPVLRHNGKPGFVVEDLTDLDEFAPIESVTIPALPIYVITAIDRGDDLRNRSPEEALAEITNRDRRPLTISEGISWLLQRPEALAPNYCFMTIGSRRRKSPTTFDARTPAIWISGGTGRDGRENRGAPKVGWCWWRNRHTWLGFASTPTT